jgi:hypothetical protein
VLKHNLCSAILKHNLCSSFRVKHQISHPYKTTDKVIVLRIVVTKSVNTCVILLNYRESGSSVAYSDWTAGWTAGTRDFSLNYRLQNGSGPTQPPNQGCMELFPRG